MMDGWVVNEWMMDGWLMGKVMGKYIYGKINTYEFMHIYMACQKGRWMDIWMDGQIFECVCEYD